MRPAAEADIAWVHAHLRDGDRMEHEFGVRNAPTDEAPAKGEAWCILLDGATVGYAGLIPFRHESLLARRRFIYYLSTDVADRNRIRYVRRSRDVLKALAATAPAWVDEFVTVPMLRYRGATRWLERVLGFRKREEFVWNDERFAVYSITRKELEG